MLKAFAVSSGIAYALITAGFAVAATPPNDDIVNAAAVSAIPYSVPVDLYDATSGAAEPENCFGPAPIENSVWYRYTATDSTSLDASITSGAPIDGHKYLALFAGASGALTRLQCLDSDIHHPDNSIRFTPKPGTTYYLEIGAFEPVISGDIPQFSIRPSPAPNTGSLTAASQITAYNERFFDSEKGFFIKQHVAFDAAISCSPSVPSISIDAAVHQGGSTVSGTGSADCSSGTGSIHFDLARAQPYAGDAFVTGPATVDLTASDFDSNYSATETGAPTYIVLQQRVSH